MRDVLRKTTMATETKIIKDPVLRTIEPMRELRESLSDITETLRDKWKLQRERGGTVLF